jgi:hypothetical protein
MYPRWLRFGEHRGLRKRVLESSPLKDTIRAVDSECYGPDGESKDSVDQDTNHMARLKALFGQVGENYRKLAQVG